MRKNVLINSSAGGYTLIEMMVSVAVIAILLAIAVTSYDTFKARLRFSQIRADMDGIAQAAYNDFTTNSSWAAFAGPGVPPSFVNTTDLGKWPIPPCPGWSYSWDNWTALPQNLARVSVYNSTGTAIYGYCVQSVDTDCFAPDAFGAVPLDLSALSTDKTFIYCDE